MVKMLKIMAIGAHPDDIEIFFYGTLAACRDRGDVISLVVATDGAAGGDDPGPALAERRRGETERGLVQLGNPIMLDLPDGRLAETTGVAAKLRDVVTETNPDLILTHAPEDYHPDHRALSHLVADIASFSCPVLLADTLMGVGFDPEVYIDITAYADEKHDAIMAHESQEPHRFSRAATIMNRFRSAQCNAPDDHRAEAWRIESRFPFADIRLMLPPSPPMRPFYVRGSGALI
jgi:LmbE family N-acetylglucosaminyl deacetylase